MEEFTVAERHQIYKKALEIYVSNEPTETYYPYRVKDKIAKTVVTGICAAVDCAIYAIYGKEKIEKIEGTAFDPYCAFSSDKFREVYPEIQKHKPQTTNFLYWFDIRDRNARIKILEQAIKETEE